jgi:hypothetical protein
MTKSIAKQIRLAARREGGEQRSWHQANEQRSRPINAVRRPDLFGYKIHREGERWSSFKRLQPADYDSLNWSRLITP